MQLRDGIHKDYLTLFLLTQCIALMAKMRKTVGKMTCKVVLMKNMELPWYGIELFFKLVFRGDLTRTELMNVKRQKVSFGAKCGHARIEGHDPKRWRCALQKSGSWVTISMVKMVLAEFLDHVNHFFFHLRNETGGGFVE